MQDIVYQNNDKAGWANGFNLLVINKKSFPGPVFTKILILRIFLRIVIFLRIRIFLFTKILILRIILILSIFLRMAFILRIFLRM